MGLQCGCCRSHADTRKSARKGLRLKLFRFLSRIAVALGIRPRLITDEQMVLGPFFTQQELIDVELHD